MDDSFSWRLRKAIRTSDKNQKEICTQVDISPAALSQYVTGKREPSIKTVASLARALGVSSDYLLGLSSSMNNDPEAVDLSQKYDLRDSTIRMFEKLKNTIHFEDKDDIEYRHIPEKYLSYMKNNNRLYVSGMKKISDVQSFYLDMWESAKASDLFSSIMKYQITISHMRQYKDRFDAYSEDFSPEEQAYVMGTWDTPEARLRKYETYSERDKKLYGFFLFNETIDYHVDGIPWSITDQLDAYKTEIKDILGAIIDECCENFEVSHDQLFQKEKSDFISSIRNLTAIYSEADSDTPVEK